MMLLAHSKASFSRGSQRASPSPIPTPRVRRAQLEPSRPRLPFSPAPPPPLRARRSTATADPLSSASHPAVSGGSWASLALPDGPELALHLRPGSRRLRASSSSSSLPWSPLGSMRRRPGIAGLQNAAATRVCAVPMLVLSKRNLCSFFPLFGR
jgi:hypothetical protein